MNGEIAKPNAKNKRRDQICILAGILEIAKEPTLKTQIMYKANLKHTQVNDYLTFMLKTNLIKENTVEGKELYSITEAGEVFLQKHTELVRMLKAKKGGLSMSFPIKSLARGVTMRNDSQQKATH